MAEDNFVTRSQQESDALLDKALDDLAPVKGAEEPTQTELPLEPKAEEPKPVVETPPETPKEEKPTEEPKVEEPVAEEPKPEEPGAEPKPEAEPVVGKASYELVNEKFGTSFADDAALQAFLEQRDELERLRGVESEHSELKTKYEEAKSQLDPRKHFVSEEEYKRQIILQKYGAEVNPALLNKLVARDPNEMTDEEILAFGKRINNPTISNDEDALELVYRDLRIETDEDGNLTRVDKMALTDAAVNVRKELNKLRDVEVPAAVDYEAERQARIAEGEKALKELEGKWEKVADELIKGFREYHLYKDGEGGKKESYFSYAVDDEFRLKVKQSLMTNYAEPGVDLTEENIREARAFLEDEFWLQKGSDIVSSYGKSLEAKLAEQRMREEDNPKPRNEQETPKDEAEKQMQDLIQYVKEGDSSQPGSKLKLG